MTGTEILQVAAEIRVVEGRRVHRLHQLSRSDFAVSFTPHPGSYLFIHLDRERPSAFLIVRKAKLLARAEVPLVGVAKELASVLEGMTCQTVSASDTTMRLAYAGDDQRVVEIFVGLATGHGSIVALDPRSGAALLKQHATIDEVSESISGFEAAELPAPADLSRELDLAYTSNIETTRFEQLAAKARKALDQRERKLRKLLENLAGDRARHGDPDEWKRYGDLILANVSTLRVEAGILKMPDLYDPEMREIILPIEPNQSPTGLAEDYFRKYAKARNALVAISERENRVDAELNEVKRLSARIEHAVLNRDEAALAGFLPTQQPTPGRVKNRTPDPLKGVRKFVSSEGVEILVGKKAVDNDALTFRMARSLDMWLHAADYPGSHVIIRNPNRGEIPQKTLIEAAKLAAFYSDARELPKAAVNYTPKKFVNKPRRSVPGLVSLSNFKTILIEPTFPDLVRRSES